MYFLFGLTRLGIKRVIRPFEQINRVTFVTLSKYINIYEIAYCGINS